MTSGKMAILVGGGPAPGINCVIGAATIRARLSDVPVVGVRDGFEHLMAGATSSVVDLDIQNVSRIHFRGGSILGISRANPTKDPALLETTVKSLLSLGVDKLLTIGGDDTAFSALKLEETAAGRIRVAHVPKTIDNDLDLPADIDTFGFQTARAIGAELVKNLMVDAFTTHRWYFVVAMGRKAGHLALGIGKAAGTTLALIPEEFGTGTFPLSVLVDTLAGAILKRMADGRRDGVAVIAEGVVLSVRHEDLEQVDDAERDEHGHVRIAEIDIGHVLQKAVRKRLADLGVKITIVSKDIGYELRCADPIPYDMEYTRDLGYCASRFLLDGGNAAMVSMQGGNFVAVPFASMLDPTTGRARVRLVDVSSARYAIAHRYMIRLRREDFSDANDLARLARTAGLTPEAFRQQFSYLATAEPERLRLVRDD
ncbi:MAG TPA: diphosphate--fructose-6-phosphate 1-phosphotransferase [Candidatus Binatia bacterium]|jgi:6-phosphofructokinase 1